MGGEQRDGVGSTAASFSDSTVPPLISIPGIRLLVDGAQRFVCCLVDHIRRPSGFWSVERRRSTEAAAEPNPCLRKLAGLGLGLGCTVPWREDQSVNGLIG
uniref:Uncharacterized protein n=1 Tax=Eutreptiella gymnastica TaxID=73025 RepID=A0A7S4GLA7_9EUGL